LSWALPATVAAFWCGLLAWQLHPPWLTPWMALALGGAALVGAWLSVARELRGRRSGGGPGTAILMFAAVLTMGAGWGGISSARLSSSLIAKLEPRRIQLTGSLREDPASGPLGWYAVVDATHVAWDGGAAALRETVWVQGTGSTPRAVRGDRIYLEGTPRAPVDPAFAATLEHKGIAVEIQADAFERAGPSSNPFVRTAQRFRAFVSRSIERLFDPREAGLLLGLALGDASKLDPGVARDFQATGLGHLLVVSGENVAMILAPVLALCLALRMIGWTRFVAAFTAVAFFVVLTGAEPSVMRAGIMATLTLVGAALGRPRSVATALSAAVFGMLVLDPFLVWSVGFQLSVAATAGMALLAQPLSRRFARLLPTALATAAATTISAQLGVAPLLLFHFHQVPGVTLPANLLAFPAVSPALLLGLGAGAVGVVSPTVARPLALAAEVPLRYLEIVANRLARAPVGHVMSGGGGAGLVCGGALVVLLGVWLRTGWRPPRRLIVVSVAAIPVFVWSTALGTGPPSGLTVRFIDVGQGDAALVTTPDGAHILVDGGPDAQQVTERLQALGVKRLDLVVATHPHADHIVGLPDVLASFPVGLVIEPGCPDTSAMQADLDTEISAEHTPVRYPRVGDTLWIGGIRLDVLSPDRCWVGTNSDPNNDSLVILLTYREDTVLFGGEPEQPAQQRMLDEHEPLHAEVMKVPHHGAATSLASFFQAVDADVAVISVGPNPYGHPVPSTIAEIQATGAQVWRTDQHGDVVVTFDGRGPVVASNR
jgi:competence protein ComEC